MTPAELEAALEAGLSGGDRPAGGAAVPPYRARQIFSRIARGARSFGEITGLPLPLRKTLAERFVIRGSRPAGVLEDRDGTVKLALALSGGVTVEAVLLPAVKDGGGKRTVTGGAGTVTSGGGGGGPEPGPRFTACLSTQAGCPLGCVFCKTGSLGFSRNLDAGEIVEQFLYLSDLARDRGGRVSRIVVMGMGEPLLNLPALRKALSILRHPSGAALSKRRITVSTSGVPEGIIDMAENGPEAELAFSLTSGREELRRRLMPGSAKHSLGDIQKALAVYREKQGRRITLEAVLLGGINTAPEDAAALADFARGLDAAVNLIPWNPVEGLSFGGTKLRPPDREECAAFTGMLERAGLSVTRRYRRGRGVAGACGQLGSR
jgi:23S rRNA (adenine2503-C2)-methyltransferase